jgi:D-sedoheptulose 7-phosphate isomerase
MSSRFVRTPVLPPSRDVELVASRIEESLAAKRALLEGDMPERTAELADVLVRSLQDGGKVLLFGNGGSAADATHLAAELVGRFRYDRGPLPALSLTDNGSSVSAIGNDYGYEDVFCRQIEAFGQPGDVAVGLTTSGNSPNVVAGLHRAGDLGLRTVALTGASGGAVWAAAELCLCMPSTETARVQECYLLLGHIVCELVEQAIFPAAV